MGHTSTKTSVEEEIAHLRGLDLKGLRARWVSVFQRPPPIHLPRHLLFAVIAYRIQADRFGDLDHETRQVLERTDSKDTSAVISARLLSFDQKRTELTPGTMLVREWDRQSQRVMVMADGFAWNGETYESLSKYKNQLSRDFRCRSLFDFCKQYRHFSDLSGPCVRIRAVRSAEHARFQHHARTPSVLIANFATPFSRLLSEASAIGARRHAMVPLECVA
jgi:hypothetical protein